MRKLETGKTSQRAVWSYGHFARPAYLRSHAVWWLRPAPMRHGRLRDVIPMPGEPTVIYSAANSQQAHLIKGLLEQQGIHAWVVNDAIQIAGGDLPLGWTAAARVVVSDENAQAARQFAEEFDL